MTITATTRLPLLNAKVVAALLGATRDWVLRQMPHRRRISPRQNRWRIEDVEAYAGTAFPDEKVLALVAQFRPRRRT